METAREIGRTKRKDGLDIRDSSREELVINGAAAKAAESGVDAEIAKTLAEALIEAAIRVQSEEPTMPLKGRNAVVVGAGKMGAWMVRFLSNRGASVSVFDPRGELEGYLSLKELGSEAQTADLVVVAGPLGTAASDLQSVIESSPSGAVFDLCSVKSHITETLLDGVKHGIKVTSVHPMFGPNVATPAGRNVLVCSCGSQEADDAAKGLFADARAIIIDVPLERHDELIAYVLGVPHLCALLFGLMITGSPHSADTLRAIQGPSFSRLAKLASGIAHESKRVYHDIQRLNPRSASVLKELEKAVETLKDASRDSDPEAFATIMEQEKAYFEGWSR